MKTFMTKKNVIIISSAIGFILFTIVMGFFLSRTFEDYRAGRLPVYFFNTAEGQLEAELFDMPQGDMYEQLSTVLTHFVRGPRGAALVGAWPVGVARRELLTDLYVNAEGYLKIWFTDVYEEMTPVDEAIFRSALTLTMSGLPFVDGVIFRRVTGDVVQTTDFVANNPRISPSRRMDEDFRFYFVDESGEGLISISYHMTDVDQHVRTTPMLERLIELQGEYGLSLIPEETLIRTVLIEPNNEGIYVDFSPEFHRNFGGTSWQALLMLKSITHTVLANNPSYNRVFFLIESERRDDFHGVSDFDLGFTTDETIMMGFTLPEVVDDE